jgi:hypothetical protein
VDERRSDEIEGACRTQRQRGADATNVLVGVGYRLYGSSNCVFLASGRGT